MNVTEAGYALIREQEGFRAKAYRDATGIWTIGYGHTSAAGPPKVSDGQVISLDEAETIFRRDVGVVAEGVREAVAQELTDAQFSALVSFAYNVGLGNFRASSVLKVVNAGKFADVPQRLQLWVKAGGRTLPGLIKRRAAEAALFASDGDQLAEPPARPEQPRGKPVAVSTTIWAAALSAILAAVNHLALWLGYGLLAVMASCLIILAAWWIIHERIKKSRELGV